MSEEQRTQDAPDEADELDAADEMDEADDLTPGQVAALTALLTSPSVEAAAKKAHLSDRTLHKYLAEPAFRRAYLTARRQGLEQATGALTQACSDAVAALRRNLKSDSPAVQVRAAQIILEMAHRGVETMELEQRLAALEAGLKQSAEMKQARGQK